MRPPVRSIMNPLDLAGLTALMDHTQGRPEIVIGLIDGPVILDHPDFAAGRIRTVPGGRVGSACARNDSAACQHGTFVAGILSARRGAPAPAICPGCTLLVRPIFSESPPANGDTPSAKPEELAEAIFDCIRADVHVLNISAAIAQPSSKAERALEEALYEAAKRGVIVGGGGWQSGNARQHRHHQPSLGDPGRRLRIVRLAASRLQPWPLHRPTGAGCARRSHHQSRYGRQAAHLRRNERRRALRDRRHRATCGRNFPMCLPGQ